MDVTRIRQEFPALRSRGDLPNPIYLDSACMSLVPNVVLETMLEYYRDFPGCAGRSLHRFAAEVTHRVEAARAGFSRFLRASGPEGIVFVRNATEAINLVGRGLSWHRGDRVLITDQEHNSNLVLWQRLAEERGVIIEVLPLPDDGTFDWDAFDAKLARGLRLISVFHTSNLDGRSLPVPEIVDRAHRRGTRVLIDGCQAAPHLAVDLAKWNVDFYALSVHKMLGPTGTGLLAASAEALGELSPLIVGGETVEWTTLTRHELRPAPHRFEAGLQNYAGILGAYAAIQFLDSVGLPSVAAHDRELNRRLTRAMETEPRVRILGPPDPNVRSSIFAFTLDGIDPNDAALFLDEAYGILLRSGRHCVHSWYDARGLSGNVRASFYLYNTPGDVDTLGEGLHELLGRVNPTSKATAKPRRTPTGTLAVKRRLASLHALSRPRGAGSKAVAARSAPLRGRAGRGRVGYEGGSD
jgi:cysteine desulfurase/selenocysteine lyase